MPKPAYPDLLKSSKWDKEKGLIAKIVKSDTGVGKALDDIQTRFDAIPWATFDEAHIQKATTVELAKTLAANAKAAVGAQVTACHKACNTAADLGKKFAADFKAKPLVPKSTSDYLAKMAAAATSFHDAVSNAVAPVVKKFEEHVKAFAQIDLDIAALVKARTDSANDFTRVLAAGKESEKNAQRLLAHAKEQATRAGQWVTEGNPKMATSTAVGVRKSAEEISDIADALQAAMDKHIDTPAAKQARLSSSDPLISKPVAAKTTAIWNQYNKDMADYRNLIKSIQQLAIEADGYADQASVGAGAAPKDYGKDLQDLKARVEKVMPDLKLNYERLQKGPMMLDEELAKAKKDKAYIPNAKRAAQLRVPDCQKQIDKVAANKKDVDSFVDRLSKFPAPAKKDPVYAALEKSLRDLKVRVDMCVSSSPGIKAQVDTRAKAINALA